MTTSPDLFPDDIKTLRVALAEANAARLAAEAELALARARATGAEAIIQQLKLTIAKYKREKYGQSAERARQLDQLEFQLEELEAAATVDELAAEIAAAKAGLDPGPKLRTQEAGARPATGAFAA